MKKIEIRTVDGSKIIRHVSEYDVPSMSDHILYEKKWIDLEDLRINFNNVSYYKISEVPDNEP